MIPEKASAVAAYGGGGTAVISGAATFLGLTPGEWQVVGVLGGLVIGAIGLAFNVYFKHRHLQIALKAAHANPEE